jgi:hypothetical protein
MFSVELQMKGLLPFKWWLFSAAVVDFRWFHYKISYMGLLFNSILDGGYVFGTR